MKVLKWIAIAIAGLGTMVLVSCAGAIDWMSSLETIKLTAADLETGGEFPDAERTRMVAACTSKSKGAKGADTMCACVADVASLEMSRLERHMVTAAFEESPGQIVSLIKGLAESGIPAERLQELQEQNKEEQIKNAIERCTVEANAGDMPEATEETVSSEEKTAGEDAAVEESSNTGESDAQTEPSQSEQSNDETAASEDDGEHEGSPENSDQ